MKTPYANKLAMTHVVLGTLTKFESVYSGLPAFVTATEELTELVDSIDKLSFVRSNKAGNTAEKAQALQALGDAAYEIAAATLACATASGNQVLAGSVDFARSDVTSGRDSAVINRCKSIYDAASTHLESLADYGVTAAKLSALKKKIEAFDAVKSSPRQKRASGAAATRQLPALFRQVDTLLKQRLDRLVVQFKSSQPDFFNEYQTSRVIVSQRGARNNGSNAVAPDVASNTSGAEPTTSASATPTADIKKAA